MATPGGDSAEREALKHCFSYLVNSIATAALLPLALSKGIILDHQRADCSNETNSVYQKAEKFLGYLERAVYGDSKIFHTFVEILQETGQARIASSLIG